MMYHCKYCSYFTRFYDTLLKHYILDHESSPHFFLECRIDGCLMQYSKVKSLKKHVERNHRAFLSFPRPLPAVEPANDLQPIELEPDDELNSEIAVNVQFDEAAEAHGVEVRQESSTQTDKSSHVAKFIMKLREVKGVSKNNCSEISQQISILLDMTVSEMLDIADAENLQDESKLNIFRPFYSLKNAFDSLDTPYKQDAIFTKAQCFVAPVELDIESDKVLYVPILEQLKELLKHDDVLAHIYADRPSSSLISDFRDGSAFETNTFLQQKNHFHLKIYIDDFTIINPLSNKAGEHKICGIYYTIGNVPIKYTSKLYTLQLLLLAKFVHVKKHGFDKILNQVTADIQMLETDGINIQKKDGSLLHFKGTISLILADNLAAHEIGGFVESFRSLKSCRFCNISKNDMQNIFEAKKLQLRTPETYNSQLEIVEENPQLFANYGIKKIVLSIS